MIVVSPMNGSNVDAVPTDVVLYDAEYNGGGSTAKITIANTGTATGEVTATSGPLSYSWLVDGSASGFEIYCQPTSGSPSGASVNTWLPLSSSRYWSVAKQGNNSVTAVLSLSIRNTTSLSVIATATVTIVSGT